MQRGILGNTVANGTFKVAGVTANTYNLTTVKDGLNVVGNGAYTSGGCALDLTLGQFLGDVDGARVSTDSPALTSPTITNGVAGVAPFTFSAVNGRNAHERHRCHLRRNREPIREARL